MSEPILEFSGDHRWLSNFFDHVLDLGGRTFTSAEHAYQATKTFDPTEQREVQLARCPGDAKRVGLRVTLRADWEAVRVDMMRLVVAAKFPGDTALSERLLATGYAPLVEGNHWHDRFWGATWEPLWSHYGSLPEWGRRKHDDRTSDVLIGENNLGLLLMARREELRA